MNKTIHKLLGHKGVRPHCALLLAILMIVGCTNDEFMQQQTPGSQDGESIPFTATISGKAATRAITENTTDKTLVTSWAVNEEVALVHNDVVDKMTVSAIDPTTKAATITGTITGSPKDGDDVTVIYPYSAVDLANKEVKADLLASQDGTLATIASKLDLRMSSGAKLKVGPASATINGTVSLANQMAVVKFSLSDGTGALAAEEFGIADKSGNTISTIIPSSATSDLYVVMTPATTQTFRFTAKKGDAAYYYSKYGATLAAGTYYQSSMTLTDMLHTPLTLEVTEDNTDITINNTLNKTIQYQINGNDKISITSTENITDLKAGDIVQFFSTNASLYIRIKAYQDYLNIKPSKKTYVYGNVMSLIDDERTDQNTPNFANDKTIGGENALYLLFYNADKLAFHDTKKLLLPATTLSNNCYGQLFSGCKGLTTLPEDLLPATTLAEGCYALMFNGCTGLTTLPENLLPAKTLVDACYQQMFQGCSGLTTAPILPATTLKDYCYSCMFFNCTKLNSVTCLATDISAGVDAGNHCLFNWLFGAGTAEGITHGTLYVNPATNIGNNDWELGTSGKEDKRWTTSNYVTTSRAINELTTNEIGWRIGNDGIAYEPVGTLPAGVKAEAVIAYVGKVDKYFDHFLAIALENVDGQSHSWADALTKVGTYAENHSITIGGTTYNENTTPSTFYDKVADNTGTSSATRSTTTLTLEQGWRLPSVTDWRYIFEGLGRIKGGLTLTAKIGDTTYSSNATPTNPSGIEYNLYYGNTNGNSSLRAAINTACGNDGITDFYYWSSSAEDTNNLNKVWYYNFNTSFFALMENNSTNKARAVFAY